uniref:Kunitz-type protease inhibitor 2-like n=1 Tax=Gouania willdenowi TaxID=441366 RepID=A0A8C5D6T1_GOUWI
MMQVLRPSVLLLVLVLVLVGGATSDQNQNQNQTQHQILQVVPLDAQSNTQNNASSDVCVLPMVVGLCRASIPRFFYNATNQSCSSFIYGGCAGNGNNFMTQEMCEDTCRGVSVSTTAPPSVREARVASADSSDSAYSAPLQRFEKSADPNDERCGVGPEVGPCRAAFQRWFFNRSTGRCHAFIYGGCQGNQNNYQSEQSCFASCSGTTPPPAKRTGNDQQQDGQSDGQDQSRNHWTAAVFLFVSLAVISVLILFIIMVTMRRLNITRRSSSVSDKEELLPDDQTSVDSFSLPDTSSPPPKA